MINETNKTCEDIELPPEQSEFLKSFAWWIQVCGNLPISMVGIVLNSIALWVFSTSSMRSNFFNRLLFTLAVFDNLYLACEISEVFRHRQWTPMFEHIHFFVNILYPFRSMFMCSSIFITIALARERYQAILRPANYHRRRESPDMNKRLFYYLFPVITFCIIYYFPRFLDLDVGEVMKCTGMYENMENDTRRVTAPSGGEVIDDTNKYLNCSKEYTLIPTKLRVNHHYVLWYINISNLLFTAILPTCILLYTNCRIYSALNNFIQRQPSVHNSRSHQRCKERPSQQARANDVKKAFILFSIVIIFIMCHTLRIILNIDEFLSLTKLIEIWNKGCDDSVKVWVEVAVPINQLLIIINSSSNFFIYSFFDPTFQKVLRQGLIIRRRGDEGHRVIIDSQHVNVNRMNTNSNIKQNDTIELSNMNNACQL